MEVVAMTRFTYFYFNCYAPDRIRAVVPAHIEYWHAASLPGYDGGPFADRTGGLIVFSAPNQTAAAAIVEQDPFVQAGLIEQRWLKEWQALG
jgi:uncharacterized protein YciI